MTNTVSACKEGEKRCPKCGGRCWRDEHPDGYMVGLWGCEDCDWSEPKPIDDGEVEGLSPTETVSDCQHNWKKTFCGDGCKEHPGVWEVCLNCYEKRRII